MAKLVLLQGIKRLNKMYRKRIAMSFSYCITSDAAKKFYDHEPDSEDDWGGGVSISPSVRRDTDEFNRMVGCTFDFHGEQSAMVRLNDMVYEFLLDPNDGYRSHLGAVHCTPASGHTGFFPNPIAKVILVDTNNKLSWPDGWKPPVKEDRDSPFSGFFFVDATDFHIWCQIGTEYYDAYYPMFYCSYSPKKNTTIIE